MKKYCFKCSCGHSYIDGVAGCCPLCGSNCASIDLHKTAEEARFELCMQCFINFLWVFFGALSLVAWLAHS